MASAKDPIRSQLQSSAMLIDMFTRDLTDDEYFKSACVGANHTAWLVGHVACAEDHVVAKLTGGRPRTDDKLHQLFSGKNECSVERSKFPARQAIDELFRNTRAHTLDALTTFNESKWGDPAPEGIPRQFFPTLGATWGMIGTHPFWHIGQITTNRTALGKPRVLTGGK